MCASGYVGRRVCKVTYSDMNILASLSPLLAILGSVLSVELIKSCNSSSGKLGVCILEEVCDFKYRRESSDCPDRICCLDSGVSQQMCAKYEDEWVKNGGSLKQCEEDLMTRIIGGRPARRGQYPHAAILGYTVKKSKNAWICGATLISSNFVLTANHCFKYAKRMPMVVMLGSLHKTDLTSEDRETAETIGVIETYTLPSSLKQLALKDIGLARLKRDITLGPNVRPACLNSQSALTRGITAIGWGIVDKEGKTSSEYQQEVDLGLYGLDECSSHVGLAMRSILAGMDKSAICAGELSGQRDTCQGDSGGPITQLVPGSKCRHDIIGVTSGGGKCAQKDSLAIYINVIYFRSWIEAIVWGNQTLSPLWNLNKLT